MENQTENTNVTSENQQQFEPLHKSFSAGLKVLSFFIPLVGLILFVVQSKDTPISAKEYGKWALIGFCTGIVLSIVWYFVVLASVSSMFKAFSF